MKLTEILSGIKNLETVHSKYNGEITVVRDLTWGTHIKAGGLTQSGGILTKIWQETLKAVLKRKPIIKNCLILGLGGGSVAKLVSDYWVDCQIVGVDIDPKIVELGKKYFGMDKIKLRVEIGDAYEYVAEDNEKYDLILIDLYCGQTFPKEFEDEYFLKKVKNLLNHDGIAIFNRLYGGNKRQASMKFATKLEKVFRKVEYIYPQANIELICYN